MVAGAKIPNIAVRVAEEHHERFCGGGYPNGKKGRSADNGQNGIHLFSRIVSVGDVYAALLAKRCYKEAIPMDEAINIMRRESGKQFEPDLVDHFLISVIESEIAADKVSEDK
jgi:HD-GYP domain-containing protein (c-di-GMP phosphodiesterase class II)